jgi:integrase/recombinase XerD
VLGYAEEEGWKDDNPALARLRRLKEKHEPIVLPEHEHIALVVARAPGLFAKLIEAALLTGCRLEELRTLTRRQIDHQRRQLLLQRTKNNRPRALSLSSAAYQLLQSLPVSLASPVVFWHGKGGPYENVSSRFRVFVKAAQKTAQKSRADFRPLRFHDLRHRFAVDYLKRGGNIYDLQQHLGHSSVKVTERYLSYLTPDEARNAKHGTGTEIGTCVAV